MSVHSSEVAFTPIIETSIVHVPDRENDETFLLSAAKEGDKEAFAALLKMYHSLFWSLAYKFTRNVHEAEDLLQEASCQAWRQVGPHDVKAFRGWMSRIIVRIGINNQKRRPRNMVFSNLADGQCKEPYEANNREESSHEVASFHEESEIIIDTMNHMDAISSQILRLFYFEYKSIKQMSDELQIPEGSVKRRLFTARKRIVKLLPQLADR